MPRKRNNRTKTLTAKWMTDQQTADLRRNGWEIDPEDTYEAAQLRYMDSTGQVPMSADGDMVAYVDPMEYRFRADVVLTARCGACGEIASKLFLSKSTPAANHAAIARYAFWASPKVAVKCKHHGVLPHPRDLVRAISSGLQKGDGRKFGRDDGSQPKAILKVQPLSV
ncbi:hypothetical protein AL755_20110 [Arthrobacter sp. ERGS1:01]|nr:hypothetical protein AL755_20110 [Arthrobacter sp. ERGS1:01]